MVTWEWVTESASSFDPAWGVFKVDMDCRLALRTAVL